ncbi:MAG: DUF5606 domain-containing protein [Williamsia sp.]|nr:DUF5606 domain-containing protein [Williamsia sp.]
MEYKKIVAITGMNGLYELLNSKTDGAIVRSLEDNSTRFVSSRMHNFSHLESIEVYTVKNNVNLAEIFNAMNKSGESLPDAKSNAAVLNYFKAVYPDLDFDRVYTSDMKKMIKWFTALKDKVEFPSQEAEAAEESSADEPISASGAEPVSKAE